MHAPSAPEKAFKPPEPSLETLLIHSDAHYEKDPDVAPPLHLSTTFETPNDSHVIYSRETHPTRSRVEHVLSQLEGGHAVMFSSGMAAVFTLLLHFHPKRVAMEGGYHGSHKALALCAKQVGGTTYFQGPIPLSSEPQEGDLWWLEVPRNATCDVFDIALFAKKVHAAKARLVVDATFATPILVRPLALGADAVMHSTTKFLNGHSDGLGGVAVFPSIATASAVAGMRSTMGNVPGSLECWLLLRSLRTLSLRVHRQSATAAAVAQWLTKQSAIAKTYHPSLHGAVGHDLVGVGKMMSAGGGVLALETADPRDAPILAKKLRLFRHATSLGGIESLVDHRFRWDPTVNPALLRLSIGLESPEDLIADLQGAIEATLAETKSLKDMDKKDEKKGKKDKKEKKEKKDKK